MFNCFNNCIKNYNLIYNNFVNFDYIHISYYYCTIIINNAVHNTQNLLLPLFTFKLLSEQCNSKLGLFIIL